MQTEEQRVLQNRIEKLIFRIEVFLHMSKKLTSLYLTNKDYLKSLKVNNSSGIKLLVLHQNLYFFEVILNMNVLFEKSKKPNQISYANYFYRANKSDYEKEFEKVMKEYEDSGIKKFRDKLIAHKDVNESGDPLAQFINIVDPKNIVTAEKIIKNLRDLNDKFNIDAKSDNYFDKMYAHFDKFYEFLQIEIHNSIKTASTT